MRWITSILVLVLISVTASAQELLKQSSSLYPEPIVERVRANIANDAWAAGVRDEIVANAEPWLAMSDDELWDLMFGATLKRSWMVWSNGYSPATGDPVPMYNWIMDALEHPWKVKCPHSGELFPKNDFKAFYDSGLDEANVFDPALADRSLLFNSDHPDPDDPLHLYGVDDGDGYVNEKGERWRFINAYLIYGQWKQAILSGINNLSGAYLVTGDVAYAHKAGVLLDRVADLYPTFDFGSAEQGVMYEGPPSAGYISTWHDACEETRQLVQAYDMVFPALRDDADLVAFLSQKAKEHGIENPKASFADIQRNIEGRILRDALANAGKIHSNYPRTEVTKAIINKVLQEPDEAFWAIVDPMLEKATAVDGVTGEKGLAGYTSFTIQGMAIFLAECAKADPEFLPAVLERHPRIHDCYRFHIDTFCLDKYYPLSGDTGHFAGPVNRYVGMLFLKPGGKKYGAAWTVLPPSTYGLLWDLYQATGDTAFVQILHRENGRSLEGLPYDLFGEAPEAFRDKVAVVIEEHGALPDLGSVNKQQWHIAILRSGEEDNERALWLDYDSGGGHSHHDMMNLGLFAYGLDLLPEFGYPPVQFGGWGSQRAKWYTLAAAHNTVVVDRGNYAAGAGVTTLWADGRIVKGIRATAADMNQIARFERTALLVDDSPESFYVVDVFRVAGGNEHTKFAQSHFGEVSTTGLDMQPAEDFGNRTETRAFRLDPEAQPGWTATWAIEDRYELRKDDRPVGMRYTDLTNGAAAGLSEAWIVEGSFNKNAEAWIPRATVQRKGVEGEPLVSTFVSVYEPYLDAPPQRAIRRLDTDDSQVAIEITLADGRRDLLILRDPSVAGELAADTLTSDAELAFVRLNSSGKVDYAALANGGQLDVDSFNLTNDNADGFIETAP